MEARVVPLPLPGTLHPHLRHALRRREAELAAQLRTQYLAGQAAGLALAHHDHQGRVRRAADLALGVGLVIGGAIGTVVTLALAGWLA